MGYVKVIETHAIKNYYKDIPILSIQLKLSNKNFQNYMSLMKVLFYPMNNHWLEKKMVNSTANLHIWSGLEKEQDS